VTVNPLRSIGGVLGGLGVISFIIQVMEFSLVMAMAGGRVADMSQYLVIANQTGILAAKLVYYPVAGLLGGYVTARVAMNYEMHHAAAAAAAQTVALIWGFTRGEFASYTPIGVRVALIILTGPAMMVGAAVRTRAAQSIETGTGFLAAPKLGTSEGGSRPDQEHK
jgi:hypothetical protein